MAWRCLAAEMAVRAGDRVSAYAGEWTVSLSTQDVAVSAGGSVSAFAVESASLVSGRVSVTCCGVHCIVSTSDWFAFVSDRF